MTKFRSGNDVPRDTIVSADVCIVGGGPAGIVLARALSQSAPALHVVLLESGTNEFDPDTQKLYEGTSSGDDYDVNASRLRYFGGSSNHWAGWCRPLDPWDFEARAWVANSGWPITRADLDPYYAPALDLVGIAREPFDASFWLDRPNAFIEPLLESETVTTAVFRFSPGPVHFGTQYGPDLQKAANVDVYFSSNVVNVALGAGGNTVSHVDAATLGGNHFRVAARAYVVAMGGIENARMLLASNDVRAAGIGNENDLVGRYFMDHPEGNVGTLMLTGRAPDNFIGGRVDLVRTVITLQQEVFRREQLNGVAFVVESEDGARQDKGGAVATRDVAAVMRAIEGGASGPYNLYLRGEPTPVRDSRVALAREKDALGVNRVDLHWQLGPDDEAHYRRAIDLIAREFGFHGIGWVKLDPATFGREHIDLFYGAHHMGTTRMHRDPRQGVVDADCRVHSVANLYVAGSSTFPSVGYSNPTLTICALALRLADHLRASLA